MKIRNGIALTALSTAMLVAAPARADDSAVYIFLKEAGCTMLPLHACDALEIENSLNILRTYQAILVNKYCGYGSTEAAKQGLEIDTVVDEPRCRTILKGLRVI